MDQFDQLPTQGVKACIDYFSKMRLLLNIPDSEKVLILKFISRLLVQFRRELKLFENHILDKVFNIALEIERNIDPRGCNPQSHPNPNPPLSLKPTSNISTRFPPTRSLNPNTNAPWCSFHKTNSHSTSDYRVLKSLKTNKTLLTVSTSQRQ
jgi:hypothetical protein